MCTQGVNIHLYEDVKNIISELRSRHTGYTDFPMELKRQVYSIICKQLASKDNTYTQTQLLEYLGLPKDVFKEKYWNMYSPDMKLRQQVYHFSICSAKWDLFRCFVQMDILTELFF